MKIIVCIGVCGDMNKMRKILKVLLTFSMLFSLCSCNRVLEGFQTHSHTFGCNDINICNIDDYNIEYKKSDNFIIYTNEDHTGFFYNITDNYGRKLDFGYHDFRGSFDIYEKAGLLILEYGFGGNSWQERYYDVSLGRVSCYFQNPLDIYNENVAYFIINDEDCSIYLVIQNIFNQAVYYEEIPWEYSSSIFKSQPTAYFIENGTKLKITYYDESINENSTQIIQLGICPN